MQPPATAHPPLMLETLERALAQALDAYGAPTSLYAPVVYFMGGNAKRIRPLLVLHAHNAVRQTTEPTDEAIKMALAVEFLHNFTLMHDDIMDNAPTRRGKPTVHLKWDTNTAILSGDVLFAEAVRLCAEACPEKAGELVPRFARFAQWVCEGQAEDMNYTAAADVSVEAYIEMIRKKTAVLMGGAMWLGAACANATPEMAEAFYRFGEQLGIAFQLMDDLLDAYADESQLGKQVGGDIIEGKNTYLWLRALQKATPAQRKELAYWRGIQGMDAEKVVQTRLLYDALGVEADTQNLASEFRRLAAAELALLEHSEGVALLAQFMDDLLARGK